ncbi:hypothetical protein G7Y89_g13134 [Cudoniella acicularis]|uniref:Uncharacterized protein n=1 Tax=Cudoniella acicularis TaxID=354080 RepID=A0A8H4VYJ0_9HELO|nr:hypothetical protein G7Y89_g13134 [Cudoniella acicularis]
MNLCLCTDFDFIKLLNDTVTELIITYQQHAITTPQSQILHLKTTRDIESEYSSIVNQLCVCIREDPFRVRFPIYNTTVSSVPPKDLLEIIKTQELSMGVYKVRVIGNEITYVYKEVDKPLYEPKDNEVLEQELRNLILLRSIDGIVQLEFSCVLFKDHWSGENSALLDTAIYGGALELINIKRGYTQGAWALALR